ncbi:unnamed protein product [Rotaria sordida]|uniref:Chromo domain-containing protein n=2 Tax=Rotaria sordida TaxID=392033 RepID=A0A814NT89_9BILA|nr:unnamed protein product [Rotaria sordida]CAF3638113.1 unnamed protein product [Rotaria sordida]
MTSSYSFDANNMDQVNLTDTNIIKFTMSTTIDNNENIWNNIKSFFNPQNSMIIIAIICLMFFFLTLCLVFIIIQLLKKKRLYKNQTKSTTNNYPKLDHHLNIPLSPNQIASLGTIISTNKDIKIQESSSSSPPPTTTTAIIPISSAYESNKTQSFDNFENELKRTCQEKGITSSHTTNISSINDDEVETVNEVLGMEERNGKVYYKVNFTGHPLDYTAWVCEEDLIPE